MCYKSHCIKIQQMVHCNLTWNRSRERGRLARLCINNQCSLIFKNMWARTVFKMTDSLSSGCGADFQESYGTVFLKRGCSGTRKGFQNTGTRKAVWGLWEESLPHCIVGCTSYLWATKERPSTPSSSDALMFGTSPEVGDRYTGPNLNKQSTVEFSISGPRHLPEDPHKSPKFWNIPLKKNHPQDGQSPS